MLLGAELIKSTLAIVGFQRKAPRVFVYLRSTLREIRYPTKYIRRRRGEALADFAPLLNATMAKIYPCGADSVMIVSPASDLAT